MRVARLVVLLALAVSTTACFQFSTVLVVRPDGSGTIEQRMLLSQAAMTQLQQLAGAGNSTSQDFDPFSEQQAREAAAALGPGVAFVSSEPIEGADGVGRVVKYAFSDVNRLRIDQGPPGAGGLSLPSSSGDRVSFALSSQPSGNSLLTISVPQMARSDSSPTGLPLPSSPSSAQLAMLKPMLAGARVQIDIEPAGQLVRTSSPFVSGRRVTLIEVDIDALLSDETLLQRLQAAQTPEAAKAILKDAPGLKLNVEPEVTIEFR